MADLKQGPIQQVPGAGGLIFVLRRVRQQHFSQPRSLRRRDIVGEGFKKETRGESKNVS